MSGRWFKNALQQFLLSKLNSNAILKAFNIIPGIKSSNLMDLKVFADSMLLVSNCYSFGLITVKSILLGRRTLMLYKGRLSLWPLLPLQGLKFNNPTILLTPGNDRGVTPHSIDQSNQFRSRTLRSIEHERVHDFHSKQFSCRQPFN